MLATKKGFLVGCSYLLDSRIEDRDYHKTMNENQLIPALDKIVGKIGVVMDNAPYHSMMVDKLPNSNSSKH